LTYGPKKTLKTIKTDQRIAANTTKVVVLNDYDLLLMRSRNS